MLATCLRTVVIIAVTSAAASATTIFDWNNHWLESVRATGGPPGPISRGGAMLHAAMFNSVNAVLGGYTPYEFNVAAPAGALPDVAAAQAARDVLTHLFPTRTAIFDAALTTQLNAVADPVAKAASIQLGQAAAGSIIALRTNDGIDAPQDYVIGNNPGDWRKTGPDFGGPASPHWPGLKPFTMITPNQFNPGMPASSSSMTDLLNSPEYTASYIDVKEKGARFGSTRTAEEEEIGSFWANDRDGTYKPPGHLNHMAQVLSQQNNLSLKDEARLFAMLNLALGDAGVVAWEVKYATDMDLWRPVTGINLGDTDGNPLTDGDPNWEPWSNDPTVNGFTPPFPAYVSGHATFGAAAAAVFRHFFGTDDMTYTIGTDDPFFTTPVFRTFDSFTEAALENARSRIYLGVHWQIDGDFGYIAGSNLGDHVAANFLQAIPEPATFASFLVGSLALLRRRRSGGS